MLGIMSKVVKVPVYVVKRVHTLVKEKLSHQGKSFSSWVRDKEVEELKKRSHL